MDVVADGHDFGAGLFEELDMRGGHVFSPLALYLAGDGLGDDAPHGRLHSLSPVASLETRLAENRVRRSHYYCLFLIVFFILSFWFYFRFGIINSRIEIWKD